MNTHRTRNVVTALAAAALALAAAGHASAEPNQPAPTKKGCSVQLQGPGAGQTIVYEHGYKFSVYGQNDKKTHTYTCNDGKWEETVTLTAGGTRVQRFAILRTAGALRATPLVR